MSRTPRLFLLDGMAIAYRSYYAFINRPLINSKGQNTSSIFGFVNYLKKVLDDQHPEYIAVVFDTPAPTFRHKEFADYKATRQKMPEDMSSMMDTLKEVVRAFNVPVIELPGFEADDIIGTLARRAEKESVDAYLVSTDKDFLQLVNKHVKVYRPGKQGDDDVIVDEKGVVERFGVPPKQVIEILGLTGDSSDNVPGVPGIGQKTAEPLVKKYGTIEGIYEHLDEIPQKGVQQKLRANREKAFLSKRLVTIDTETPLSIDFHELKAKEKNSTKLLQFYTDLEFRSFARNLQEEVGPIDAAPQSEALTVANRPHEYTTIKTDEAYFRLLSELKKAKEFVFDTETTSQDPMRAELVGISFSFRPHTGWYLPVDVRGTARNPDPLFTSDPAVQPAFALKRVVEDLREVFRDASVRKYGQNVKYDAMVLERHGIPTAGVAFDTMVASYVLRADGRHNLDALALEYLKYQMVSYESLTDGGKKDIRTIPVDDVGVYSAEDSDITFELVNILHDRLSAQGMELLCTDVEFPLIGVLAGMELTGVAVDEELLGSMSKDLERQLDNLVRDIYRAAGEEFNINSTQQLGVVLFEKLNLPPARKTKTGYSTDVAVLETLRGQHPIVESLLEYRQLSKLKSTYIDAIPRLIHPDTHRVHTSFNQTVAATGRLSSSDPNLQNIPIRTNIGREMRRAFVPGDRSMLMMSADYSQIELRIMAHISGDKGLLEAFNAHEDIHSTTAAKVFGVTASELTRDMRRKAKEVNFGIMYGIGAFGLASRLDISQSEAREIIARYFERFPKVNQYIADTIGQARRDGYVSTLLGRRRYLPDIHSRNANIRQNAERQAINMPIQGTAADMIKCAMIAIDQAIATAKLRVKMLLQVHDELVFEVPRDEEQIARQLVEEKMTTALPLDVPIEVEIGVGSNWLEAH